MRVPQFSSYVEPEILRVLNGTVSQFNANTATLFKCLLEQQRLQYRVQLLTNVLQCMGFLRTEQIPSLQKQQSLTTRYMAAWNHSTMLN